MNYKEHTKCRVCGNSKLIPYLDLGFLPLSNNLAESATDHIHHERYPLSVLLCEKCGLSQLSVVISREKMFSHYVYRSGISQGYIDHCKQMAVDLQRKYWLNENSFVIDIAGNDGTLLAEFKKVIGCRVLNIDPAENLYKICEDKDVRMFCKFWSIEAVNHLKATLWPKADIITATNVFAHVDDVVEFITAAKLAMKPTGKLIMEFPYLINFIEGKEFDTVYFEHLSYFSIYPLTVLCESLGLNVENVIRQDIHGGSVRVTIGYSEQDWTVAEFVKAEIKYRTIEPYINFAQDVQLTIRNFRDWALTSKGIIAGFAASAKGNTLLNCAGITAKYVMYIVDETPEKIGKYSPGTRIPIVPIADMIKNQPDYLILLSWNFADELMSKARAAGYTGKFVIPIPELKIIE